MPGEDDKLNELGKLISGFWELDKDESSKETKVYRRKHELKDPNKAFDAEVNRASHTKKLISFRADRRTLLLIDWLASREGRTRSEWISTHLDEAVESILAEIDIEIPQDLRDSLDELSPKQG